jgi:hypothetical protein
MPWHRQNHGHNNAHSPLPHHRERLNEAIEWLSQDSPLGQARSQARAAKRFRVPASTLSNWITGKSSRRSPRHAHKLQQDLTAAEEQVVEDYALALSDQNFPVTPLSTKSRN